MQGLKQFSRVIRRCAPIASMINKNLFSRKFFRESRMLSDQKP